VARSERDVAPAHAPLPLRPLPGADPCRTRSGAGVTQSAPKRTIGRGADRHRHGTRRGPGARSSRRPAMPVGGDTRSSDQGDRTPSRSIAQRRASPDPGRPVRALPPCPRPEPARPYHLLRRGTPAARSTQRHRSPSRGARAGLHGRRRHRPALGRTAEVGGPGSTAFRPDPLDTPHHPVADGRSSRVVARGSRLHRRALHGATALEAGGRGRPRLRGSPASGRSRRTDTLTGGCRSR